MNKNWNVIINEDIKDLGIEELVALGIELEAEDVLELESERQEQARTQQAQEAQRLQQAREFLPPALREFVEYGWFNEFNRTSGIWWNLVMRVRIPKMAMLDLRFDENRLVEEPYLIVKNDSAFGKPIRVMEPYADCNDIEDYGERWFVNYRAAGEFQFLPKALASAHRIGDRFKEIEQDVKIKNQAERESVSEPELNEAAASLGIGAAASELGFDPEELTMAGNFEEAMVLALRGLVRDELRKNEREKRN